MNEKEVFYKYVPLCFPDEDRIINENMRKVFSSTDKNGKHYINATDAHIMICLESDEEHPEGSYIREHYCNTYKEFDLRTIRKALTEIKDEPELSYPDNEIPCKECNGSGIVTWKYTDSTGCDHEMEAYCPVCDGDGCSYEESSEGVPTGRVYKDKTVCFKLKEKDFMYNAMYIGILDSIAQDLGVDVIKYKQWAPGATKFIITDRFSVFIAPMVKECVNENYIVI